MAPCSSMDDIIIDVCNKPRFYIPVHWLTIWNWVELMQDIGIAKYSFSISCLNPEVQNFICSCDCIHRETECRGCGIDSQSRWVQLPRCDGSELKRLHSQCHWRASLTNIDPADYGTISSLKCVIVKVEPVTLAAFCSICMQKQMKIVWVPPM